MNPEAVDAQMEEKPRGEGPGRALREAREQAGFTIEHVAGSLNLEKSTIDALEKDDISRLPGPAYVKGYLRNYARLLELDAEPLMEAYGELAVPIPDVVSLESAAPPVDHRVGIQVIGGLVALVLIVLLGWFFTRPHPAHVPTPQIASGQAGEQAPKSALKSGVGGPMAVTAPSQAPTTVTPSKTAESAGAGGGVPAATTLSVPPASVEVAPQASTSSKTSVATPAIPGASPQPSATTASPGAAVATVSLQLNEKSWVQIQDASGKQLVRGLLGAGIHRVLSGAPPFSVFLGFAPGVVLSVDGHTVDAAQYVRSDHTARFVLSADGNTHR